MTTPLAPETIPLVPAVILTLGFPLLQLLLTELIHSGQRRQWILTPTLRALRNLVMPALAAMIFVTDVWQLPADTIFVRLVQTSFWLCVLYAALSFINDGVFGSTTRGSWQERVPKLLRDLTRAILLQIILEEEANGVPMFSSSVLSQIIRYYGHAMQGMMGSYLEKNVQAFTDIQRKFTGGGAAGTFEGKPFSPEMWTQFMNVQGPMMQGMMNNYIDQSKSLFVQMQEQMQSQSKNIFGTFPFVPPVPTDKT